MLFRPRDSCLVLFLVSILSLLAFFRLLSLHTLLPSLIVVFFFILILILLISAVSSQKRSSTLSLFCLVGTLLHLRRLISCLIFHFLSVYVSIELEREQIISLQSFHNYLVIQKNKNKNKRPNPCGQVRTEFKNQNKKTSHATIKPYPEVIIRRTLHYRGEKKTKVQPGKKKLH